MSTRKDFDYNAECGYLQCHDCNNPRYPMEFNIGDECECGCNSFTFYRRSEREIRLIEFALSTLQVLEQHEDWSSETLDCINSFAAENSLVDEETHALDFKRAPDAIE